MSRKHILRDSIVIFVFLGSMIPLIVFWLLGDNHKFDLHELAGRAVVLIILYCLAIIVGSLFSIPAALLNYGLIKFQIKYGYYNYLLKSYYSAILIGLANGLMIGTVLFIFASIRSFKLEIEPGTIILTHLPCLVSSVVFCLYRRKKYAAVACDTSS